MRARRRILRFETFETRIALDGAEKTNPVGLPWLDLASLSYSFALDGVSVGDFHSNLHTLLGKLGPVQTWKSAFSDAMSAWMAPLQFAAHEVQDSNAPFGSSDSAPKEVRYGDVRIAAVPLSSNVLAQAVPLTHMTQGEWAGNILLNANAQWNDLHQVFSVTLHEFGHVLGLGHSPDPNSPMYFDGSYSAQTPTPRDIATLKELYAGIQLEEQSGTDSHEESHEWREEPKFAFQAADAVALQASLGTHARYNAVSEITSTQTSRLFHLLPFGELDDTTHLDVTISSLGHQGLIPRIYLFDESGDILNGRILHNDSGTLVVELDGVESNHSYYLAVVPAAGAALHQVGSFELFAEYSATPWTPHVLGTHTLSSQTPLVEQSFVVTTTRLVHALVLSTLAGSNTTGSAVWGAILDSQGQSLGQFGMLSGDARSIPLVLLAPGDYRIVVKLGSSLDLTPQSTTVRIAIDELSIDIGPGLVDPLTKPVATDLPGLNPTTGTATPPIVVNGPIFPIPSSIPSFPRYPTIAPWNTTSWNYWPNLQTTTTFTNSFNPMDTSGDGILTPIDALLVINALNLETIQPGSLWNSKYFWDVNGDQQLSPSDAIWVLNQLNKPSSSGEGESASPFVDSNDLSDLVNGLAQDIARRKMLASQLTIR